MLQHVRYYLTWSFSRKNKDQKREATLTPSKKGGKGTPSQTYRKTPFPSSAATSTKKRPVVDEADEETDTMYVLPFCPICLL